MGTEYLPYLKIIEAHVRAFLTLNILSIGTVLEVYSILTNNLTNFDPPWLKLDNLTFYFCS